MTKEEIKQEMEAWKKYFDEAKKLLDKSEYKNSYSYIQYKKYKQMYEEYTKRKER